MAPAIAVYLEIGSKRTFAGAIEWPGWCRSGKTDAEALEALVAYGARYAAAIRAARAGFSKPASVDSLDVVERLKGGGGTDFGVPGEAPRLDRRPLDEDALKRQSALLKAAWATFDRIAADAVGVELRKGPRGGGRDLAKMVTHVFEGEQAYLSQLGSRGPEASGDVSDRMSAVRTRVLESLAATAQGEPLAEPNRVRKLWSPRYFVRRSAWHALDHAWEIEDRAVRQFPSDSTR